MNGRLRWNAQVAANVEVRLCVLDRLSACQDDALTTRTGADGAFSLSQVPPGEYSVAIQAPPSNDFFYLTAGAFVEPAQYTVEDGGMLDLGDQAIYRLDLEVDSPQHNSFITDANPVLTWQAYPGAEYYEVSLAPAYGDPILSNARVYSPSLAVETALLGCPYTWWVEAFDEQNGKLAENGRPSQFTVEGQSASCVIDGLAPADGARISGNPLALAWAPHPLAQSYRVTLWRENGQDDAADEELVLYLSPASRPTTPLAGPLSPGDYAWTVNAYSPEGAQIAGSEPAEFTVGR